MRQLRLQLVIKQTWNKIKKVRYYILEYHKDQQDNQEPPFNFSIKFSLHVSLLLLTLYTDRIKNVLYASYLFALCT